mgnify:CR=1 FL=1
MEENNHMKATGIVRRIDDLGRVVVPKEIRRTLRIREGDPLEIFTDREGEIILKKYSLIGELSQCAGLCAEALAQTTGQLVCITDRDHVVAAVGAGKRDFEGKPISKQLEGFMDGEAWLRPQPMKTLSRSHWMTAGSMATKWSVRSYAKAMRSARLYSMAETRKTSSEIPSRSLP